jgi:HK97 gp10 family phage protein|nr:MAG TPA: type I neck protein [Caudoviricetes sp.]
MSKKNYVDFKSAYKYLNNVDKRIVEAQLKSTELATDYAAKHLKSKTPVSDINSDHAKEHIVYSKPNKGNPMSEVGFDKEVAWRVHFVEYGTIKHDPQPFMQQTMKDIENKVTSIIQNEMRRRLSR